MFEKNEKGNTLHNNLIMDSFFNRNEHSLYIIDDYHTKDITPEAINFFREGFQNTGLSSITIFYQIKAINQNTQFQIENLSTILGIEYDEFSSFLVFLLTSINSKNRNVESLEEKLRYQYCKRKAEQTINSTLDFISSMNQVGIDIQYQAYNSLNFKPPFHGRYWINKNKGYIVDGSLNTYTKGKIFAQKMDEENFSIISNLMNDEILPKARQYQPLTRQRIDEIHNLLMRYFNRR